MLYQELPRIDSTPLDGWGPWLVPILIAAAAFSATLVILFLGYPLVWALPVLVIAAGAAILLLPRASTQKVTEPLVGGPDYSLVGSALSLSRDAVALTNGEGSLLVVNGAYRERFGTTPPLALAGDDEARDGLKLAQSMAWRDGAGQAGERTSARAGALRPCRGCRGSCASASRPRPCWFRCSASAC